MKILFVASECAPFVKTGGLADVIGAVPKTLAKLGAEVKIVLPAYPALGALLEAADTVLPPVEMFGGPVTVLSAQSDGLDLLLLDAPHLFDRPGNIYLGPDGADWSDNHMRFGTLSLVGARIAIEGAAGWLPDVVHVHDWQAGLTPVYLRQAGVARPKSVLTIHNIAFQGLFDASICAELNVKPESFVPERAEFYGMLGFLKGGIACSDRITTVSPTYARELLLPEFGLGLEGILQARRDELSGILNGIDLDAWDPGTDERIPANYSARSLKKKAANRAEVLRRFALDSDDNGPVFCVVSRLTEQKGLDLLLTVLPDLVRRGAKLALLGSGDKSLEDGFVAAARTFAGSVGVVIGYDEPLAHLLQGGSDAILIPSRFEPCGLTQLYGFRYGTLPVVARTGGLADTIIDANEAAIAAGCATGVQFAPVTAPALDQAIARTCDLYRQPRVWQAMMRQAMKQPVGWDKSAHAYLDLYQDLLGDGLQESR
ncbi:MAG: glycogen synthase GlgA [Pseudomonadota bacterium]